MTDLWILSAIALATSTITGIVGIGGGSLLIASMPGLLPNGAIIPVHGVVQFFSNFSRATFAINHIRWNLVAGFAIGAMLGAALAGRVFGEVNSDYIPIVIALYILYATWGPKLELQKRPRGELPILGFAQTSISMFVGAVGPLAHSVLLRHGLSLHSLVVTSAVFMSITHITKLTAFGVLGFDFKEFLPLIAAMTVATIAGSFIGTRFRSRLAHIDFQPILKVVFTLLAVRMIWITLA